MSRSVCTNKSSIFLMSLEKKHIAALVSESAGANAGGAFGVTGSYWNVSERAQFRRAELTVSARPFRGAPRGALGDDLACPAGVAIQIHRCNLGPLDHAFGCYKQLKGNIYDSSIQYELFVDMGEGESEARSVKRTRVDEAFRSVGTKMRFLFDYGDNWEFLVELIKRKPKEPKVKLPRLLLSAGKAPTQYPDQDDEGRARLT